MEPGTPATGLTTVSVHFDCARVGNCCDRGEAAAGRSVIVSSIGTDDGDGLADPLRETCAR
jgi:hypothetical protein